MSILAKFAKENGLINVKKGDSVLQLALQGGVHMPDKPDFGTDWRLSRKSQRNNGRTIWRFTSNSTIWKRRWMDVEISSKEILFQLGVEGKGDIDTVAFFAGLNEKQMTQPSSTMKLLKWAHRDYVSTWTASPFSFRNVFNPQPNASEGQTLPCSCSQRISSATTFGPEIFNTFFAPPPYAYVLDNRWTIGLAASKGENNYNHFDYRVGAGWGIVLSYDGMTRVNGEWKSPCLRIAACDSWEHGISEYLDFLREKEFAPLPKAVTPPWAWRPVVCGWGQQTACATLASKGETLPWASPVLTGAMDYATQDFYEEFVRNLEKADLPYGILVIDAGWSPCFSLPHEDRKRWPDLRGFISRMHARDKRVLLWLATWNPKGLPVKFLMPHADGLKDCVDPSNPEFCSELGKSIHLLISPSGLDADGFKLDFTGDLPRGRGYEPSGNSWGLEMMLDYVTLIHREMKAAKGDTVLETHCANPLFANVTEMLRLNDIFSIDEDICPMMEYRATLARLVNPLWPIDTDNDPFVSKKAWMKYMRKQVQIGVPSLYTLTHLSHALDGRSPEKITNQDIAEVRKIWRMYLLGRNGI